MKTLVFVLSVGVLVLACAKNEDYVAENYKESSLTWQIGSDYATDTTILVPKSIGKDGVLRVDDYSICPNTDLRIIANLGKEVLLDTIYHDGDGAYSIPDSQDKSIQVHSYLVANDGLILCVWLGRASLRYDYVE
ncbi:MAG: hypothetical protein KDC53_03760 [Saprospiraceae bacterium]|nr:hypothetical protein [Saprospiraceae bacterium]